MIVGSVLSNAELISKVIKSNFKIDWDNSQDQFIKLAEDRVGYRGKNYVAIFREEVSRNINEYKRLKDLRFEIQIKTLLDYAWGKIEHGRNYKTVEELPEPEKSDVGRRFKLAAGALELVDNEFDRLSKETEQIANPILNKISKGDLNLEISLLSLRHFLTLHFKGIPGFIELFRDPKEKLLDELSYMGIKTIADLNEIIKPDIKQFKSKYAEASKAKDYVSFSALLRDILIINDPDGYFKKAWKHHYDTLDYHCWKVYQKFEVDRSNFPPTSDLDFDEGGD